MRKRAEVDLPDYLLKKETVHMKKVFITICILGSFLGLTSCADIHKAVKSGSLADVEMALANGEDVNKQDSEGNTPLIAAARHGDFGIVQTLVKKGATIKARNKEGYDALLALANYSMPGKPGTSKNAKPAEPVGITIEGHLKTAEFLLNEGADVNAKNDEGNTALILAAQLNKKDIVELLLNKGADVHAANLKGYTALMLAASKGQGDVICPLVRKGADINAKDNEGNTALQYATQYNHNNVLQIFRLGCSIKGGPEVKESTDSSLQTNGIKMADVLMVEKSIESLRNPEPSVRWEAARRLGELKDVRAVIPLIGALTDEHPYVRRRSAVSLGKLQDFRAVEPLMKSLRDEDAFVQKYALESLTSITGQKFGNDPQKWQEWWNQRIRQN